MFLFVTCSFFLSVLGCAGEAKKSSSEPASTPQLAQTEGGKDQPPSGEVQERAVPPRMAPGVTAPLPTRPIQPVATPPPPLLPGEFALEAWAGSGVVTTGVVSAPGTPYYITAVNRGCQRDDAFHTNAAQVGFRERFKLVVVGNGQFTIQTARVCYVRSWTTNIPPFRTVGVVQSDVITIGDTTKFKLLQQPDSGTYAIQTVSGYYLGLYRNSSGTFSFTTDRSVIGPGDKFKLIWCDPLS